MSCCSFRLHASRWTVLAVLLLASSPSVQAGRVQVRMPEQVEVSVREVFLRDVAKISGDNESDVRLAGGLDLTTLQGTLKERAVVTAEYVRIRLVLRGFLVSDVEVLGSESTAIVFRELRMINDADVEHAALEVLADTMNVSEEDVQVSLTNPFMLLIPADLREMPGLRVEVMRPADTTPGQKSLSVRLWNGDDLLLTRTARFNVFRRYRLAVSRVSLTRNQPIDDNLVQVESRFLDKDADEVSPEALRGRIVQRSIGAGEVIALKDLVVPRTSAVNAVLVRRRDNVPVIARIGGIEIRMRAAEALQDGRAGDYIQMKNLETQKTFTGKVHPLGHIEVH